MKYLFIAIIIGFVGLLGFNWVISSKRASSEGLSAQESADSSPIAQREQVLNSLVLVRAIKQGDDKLFQQLQAETNGTQQADANQIANHSMLKYRLNALLKNDVSDEGQRKWAEAYLQQIRDAKLEGSCNTFAFPSNDDTDPKKVQDLLSSSTQHKSEQALAFALADKTGSKTNIDSLDSSVYWSPFVTKLQEKFGDDVSLLNGSGEATSQDKNRPCDVVIGTMETLLSMPDNIRTPALRKFMQGRDTVVIF
ncbi:MULTISPECIES: hypothetical protein [unclassified Moraxella]|uniref:hypothetical protein n=1 Tax=unclassified Moraxella TaxID=2685852 RepID=UPI003AF4127D